MEHKGKCKVCITSCAAAVRIYARLHALCVSVLYNDVHITGLCQWMAVHH